MHDGQPALVASCSGTADVVDAVGFARDQGLAVAIRGGGHSVAGLSSIDGGMLIDLAPMSGVQVDPERRVAHVQGGALWADVDRETQAFGLAAPGGVVSDTGVAGPDARRRVRMGEAQVRALLRPRRRGAGGHARTASVLTASADSHPDLFWALRGGGGNFGIVTSFTFDLQPLGPIVGVRGDDVPGRGARRRHARLALVRRRARRTRSPR